MTLKLIKKYSRAYGIDFSDKYIVTTTGSKVEILDKHTENIISKFEKLDHGYKPFISQNEELLVVRGTVQKIYFYSLEKMELIKKISLNKYYCSQNGESVISNNEKYLYYLVSRKDLCSSFIKINLKTFEIDESVFDEDRIVFNQIVYIEKENKYLLTGYDKNIEGLPFFVMTYDNDKFSQKRFIDVYDLSDMEYIGEDDDYIMLYSFIDSVIRVFNKKYELNREIQVKLMFDEKDRDERFRCIKYDENRKIIYIGTDYALYAVDFYTGEIKIHFKNKYGFLYLKLKDNYIYVTGYSGGIFKFKLLD